MWKWYYIYSSIIKTIRYSLEYYFHYSNRKLGIQLYHILFIFIKGYDIHILKESDNPNKTKIFNEIAWLTNGLQKGDQILFYYSGHGTQVRDSNKDESDGLGIL